MSLSAEDISALEVLGALRDSGVLSDEEFAEQKRRVLLDESADPLSPRDVKALNRLADLNKSAILSDDEFAEQKQKILGIDSPPPTPDPEEDPESPPRESVEVSVEKPIESPVAEGTDAQSAVEKPALAAEENAGDEPASESADPTPVGENLTEKATHTKGGNRERLIGAVVGSALAVLVGVVLIAGTGDDTEAASQTEVIEPSGNNDLGATTTTTTTTLPPMPPMPPTDDLPMVAGADASTNEVEFAQRFLTDLGYPTLASGSWGPDTEKAVLELRSNYGLGAGGFDQDLWQKVLSSEPPGDSLLGQRDSDVEGIMIPASAVYIGGVEDESFVTSGARYMLPYFQDDTMEVSQWYQSRYLAKDHDSWRWCRQTTEGSGRLRFYWWQEPDRMLVVLVREMGRGRVDILIAVGEGASPRNCFGHFTSTTTTTRAPSYRDPTIAVTCPKTLRSSTSRIKATFGLAVGWDSRAGFRSLHIDYGDGTPSNLKQSEDHLAETFSHSYSNQGSYRVEATITDKAGQKASDFCVWRWYNSPTTTTKAPAKSSSGSSSGGYACYVGMNFEDCQDAMGAFGQTPYFDCQGSRSVWWSSNWWIIGFIGGTPVVSKEKYYCS